MVCKTCQCAIELELRGELPRNRLGSGHHEAESGLKESVRLDCYICKKLYQILSDLDEKQPGSVSVMKLTAEEAKVNICSLYAIRVALLQFTRPRMVFFTLMAEQGKAGALFFDLDN